MSIVTFSSGVHVGARNDAADWTTWFAATPVAQFATFSLELASAQILTAAEGRAGDREPILLRFQGRGMVDGYGLLKAIDAREILGERPRPNITGFLDASARAGYLVKIDLRLAQDATERSEWGVLANVRNSVGPGSAWSVSATLYPCDLLWRTATTACYLTPVAYAEHVGGS